MGLSVGIGSLFLNPFSTSVPLLYPMKTNLYGRPIYKESYLERGAYRRNDNVNNDHTNDLSSKLVTFKLINT